MSMIFGDQKKEKFRRLLFEGEKRCSYQVWDYVVMGNHYHALIHIPEADAIPRAEVLLDEQGVLEEFSDHLGYRRKHKAQEARAWDEVYCLKKHRKWIE